MSHRLGVGFVLLGFCVGCLSLAYADEDGPPAVEVVQIGEAGSFAEAMNQSDKPEIKLCPLNGSAASGANMQPMDLYKAKMQQYNERMEQYKRTQEESARLLAEHRRQQEESRIMQQQAIEYTEKQVALQTRAEELLERQEEQMQRFDEILTVWEKQQEQYQQYLDSL